MRTISFLLGIIFPVIGFSQNCPYTTDPNTKLNKIHLYFPTINTAFPNFGSGQISTDPLTVFDADALFSGASSSDLQENIRDLVADHFCELDVGVLKTQSLPVLNTTTNARANIIGISTSDDGNSSRIVFGLAQGIDLSEEANLSYASIWVGELKNEFSGTGGALNSSHTDISKRWVNAIATTAAHEAAHNYGLDHSIALPSSSQEDTLTNHLMAEGNTTDGNNRATVSKHFSNTSFGALAHRLGLQVNTLHSWELINPNNQAADQLIITVFSKANNLTINNADLSRCPWQAPRVEHISNNHWLFDDIYKKFEIIFDQPQPDSSGQVPAGHRFHIGLAFEEDEAVIVVGVTLKNGNLTLPLSPRTVGFDQGFIDTSTGEVSMRIFNNGIDSSRVRQLSTTRQIRLENLRIDFLPRVADLKSMRNFDGGIFPNPEQDRLVDFRGLKVLSEGNVEQQQRLILDTVLAVFFGKLTDPRRINITFDSTGCVKGIGPGDVFNGKINYCFHGTLLSLFPSTMIYVTATIVEPNATYFDPNRNEFVTGDLRTYVQYQFSGIKPDFNNNGIDDLIDIKNGTSKDADGNGIPDDIIKELPPTPESPSYMPWWFWGIIIVLGLIIIFLLINRNRETDDIR
ncbi:MAG: hypothetical protein IPJ74_19040 [Saprospiraceae bacterium]|nr:hypothetical protein [Saprospiraceae bacterium]